MHRLYSDQDADRFGIETKYSWDDGGFTFGVQYIRDMTAPGFPDLSDIADGNNIFDFGIPALAYSKNWALHINPSLAQSWGPFSIHFEADLAWGKTVLTDVCDTVSANNCGAGKSADINITTRGFGAYLDASYNYGAGDITLLTWYVHGQSLDTNSDKLYSLVSMGDFAPFLVAYYGQTRGYALNDTNDVTNLLYNFNTTTTFGQFGIGLLGNHAINDDIKLNWGLGYLMLAKAPIDSWSKSVGFEVDLGATFQILDNLSFESQFGYMFNGKALRDPKPDGTFAWLNVLAVTF
jgi:hypothetical protein